MAFRLLRVYSSCIKPLQQILFTNTGTAQKINHETVNILKTQVPITCLVRPTSIFAKYSAENLWKSVVSVSNAGRQRGRGRGTKGLQKNLNRGQIIGVGKINMLWPGLTGPIMRGSMVVKQQKLPEDKDREAKLIKIREEAGARKARRVHPLERGWTSARVAGRSIGAPDPVNDVQSYGEIFNKTATNYAFFYATEQFYGFDTKVLEHKIVNHMTGNLGRKKSYSTFVITGNKNGLCGIAVGRAPDGKGALRLAKNRAGFKLMYIKRYKEHTVYHDFFSQFGATKVYITKKNEGYGLKCHRAIKCACEVIGIKDLHVKVEGAMNYQHIIKAFLIGLLKQKTHDELAEEKQLHLVEFRKENLNYPKVVATPSVVRKPAEVKSTEILDFKEYVMGGKVILKKKKLPPFYVNSIGYKIWQSKMEYLRNQEKVRIRMLAEHGEYRSFLTDKYPEAKPDFWSKKKRDQRKAEEN